jgi:hypothetical protein
VFAAIPNGYIQELLQKQPLKADKKMSAERLPPRRKRLGHLHVPPIAVVQKQTRTERQQANTTCPKNSNY